MARSVRYFNRVSRQILQNSWTPQQHMQRLGRTPAQQEYYNSDGSTKKGYSTVQSQQNSKPVFTYRSYNSAPQNVYKMDTPAPAPAPPPSAAPPPTEAPPQSPAFDDRLAGIQQQNNQQNNALMQQLAADRANYASMMQRMEQSIASYQNSFNQGSSVGGQETALMINPAQSVAEKSRSTSKGTQQFNRRNRNLKISNVSI